jgi:peptidoglycan/xylan/chitin deacetylase (PgdA/CDA1 family)
MRIIHTIRHYFEKRGVVLMYHRIAMPFNDHWELCVSPQHFEQQLQVLTKKKVVSLQQLTGELHANNIAITFDDGYIDNYTTAKPLLEKYRLPATFFITTGQIEYPASYWWDELARLVGDRQLYMQHWQRLLPLTYDQQQHELTALRATGGAINGPRPEELCMSRSQLLDLASNALFDLGVHTVTHPALAHHSPATQLAEIAMARDWLYQLTGRPARLLAYPYGNYDETTINIASGQQFDAAFSTEEQAITKSSGKYRLGRFQVKDWDGHEFAERLEQWLKRT